MESERTKRVLWDSHIDAFREQLLKEGRLLREVYGDGNCLFSSIAEVLHGSDGKNMEIRAQVCDYLEKNRDMFEDKIDWNSSYDSYLTHMRKSGTFGGEPELTAMADLYNLRIKIWKYNEKPNIIEIVAKQHPKDIELSYHKIEGFPPHYNYVVPID